MKTWDKWTKKELLELQQRGWDKISTYSSVALVNTRFKHDSGYNMFAIIGIDENGVPSEIAGYMDDFRLASIKGDILKDILLKNYCVAIDCSMHGVFRIHAFPLRVRIGSNTSTTLFDFVE